MQPYESIKDEFELKPGVQVRRLAIKTPITSTVRPVPVPRGQWNGGVDRSRNDSFRGPPPGPRQDRPLPATPPTTTVPTQTIFVQCAAETGERDAAIAGLTDQLREDLANLRAESQATLSGLRLKLLLINLATMAATALGCIWLVQLGLVPLRRLSEAVGKVSPNDLRLPYEEKNLPRELKPIVNRLNETFDELRRAFAREKQAAADISHELRTPLAALKTTIEVALKKPRSPEEYRETLEDCRNAAQQMNQLVERLLTLARLDAGVDHIRPSLIDVAALTEQCTAMVRPLAEANGLDLQLERNGPINLQTDPNKFREIVTNLLHNAIAYNRPKGKVVVDVQAKAGKVRLEVKDTGIGISDDAKSHIFDRFYRVDSSRNAEGMHSGLGLSIVKGYVDLMGGTITVDSAPGRGSTFRVELPRVTEAGRAGPMNEAERLRSHS
jgi:heavy metal sensor kinase